MENAASFSDRTARLGWGWLLFQLLLLPSLLTAAAHALPVSVTAAQINSVFYCLNFLAVCLIFSRFLIASARDAARKLLRLLSAVGLGLIVYFAADTGMLWLLNRFFPTFSNVNDENVLRLFSESPALMLPGVVLLTPLAEECFYRGLIFRRLYSGNRVAAYALSVLVFAAVHVVGYLGVRSPGQLILCYVQYLPAGLCLAWAYAHSGTILAPVLMHMIINARSALSLL